MSLEQLLERMRAEANPKAAVELPFEWAASVSEAPWGPPPSLEAVDGLLQEFSRLVRRERRKDKALPGGEIDVPKVLRDERADVMDAIRSFNSASGNLAFPQLNRQRLALELALLVRRPRLLSPEQAGWSGPCCLLIHYAKCDPHGFAQLAIDLAQTGSGLWRGHALRAPVDVREAVSPGETNTCVAALVAAVSGQLPQALKNAQAPQALAESMRQLGYREVEIRDAAWLEATEEDPQWIVTMLLLPGLLSEVTGHPVTEPHWALLRRLRNRPEIVVKFITYGGSWELALTKSSMLSGISRVIRAL